MTDLPITDIKTAEWTTETLKTVSDRFEGRSPEDILRWGFETFSPHIALATGFGAEGVILMHMTSLIAPDASVFYLDTDLLFKETYKLRDVLAERLGTRFTRVHSGVSLNEQADEHGPALWSVDPNLCCQIRKVKPLREFLSTQNAWITAIRRDQTKPRANAGIVEWDRTNALVKLNPLAGWTHDQVWDYIRAHDLPYNPLHDEGYPSIGCWPCTRPVADGADPRSGRWAGQDKNECGIHVQQQPDGTVSMLRKSAVEPAKD